MTRPTASQITDDQLDELYDRLNAVRALHQRVTTKSIDCCTHCSERDYPDYDVQWPCPTIRALGETGDQS